MNDTITGEFRAKMADAVRKSFADLELDVNEVQTGEENTVVEVDMGYHRDTHSRHQLKVVKFDDSTLIMGIFGLLTVGVKGALHNRVSAMFRWFFDKEDLEIKDAFLLQLGANQYLQSNHSQDELIWIALEGSNCGHTFTKVQHNAEGDVYITTHMQSDFVNVPQDLDTYLRYVLSHAQSVVQRYRMIAEYVADGKELGDEINSIFSERFEDADKTSPPDKEEGNDNGGNEMML